jgi:hypothetical protein
VDVLNPLPKPISLVAERAVRHLKRVDRAVDSRTLARELLSTRVPDETTAQRLLATAFGGDARLAYESGRWSLRAVEPSSSAGVPPSRRTEVPEEEPDRVLIFLQGERQPHGGFDLRGVSALRLLGDDVLAACGGDTVEGRYGNRLRRATLDALDGAIPVIHDPPGSLKALESWLGEPISAPVSLRRIAQKRVGLPAHHDLETLVGRLGLEWRPSNDPLEQADLLDACLQKLRRPGETLQKMRTNAGARPIDWNRYAFNREFLRRIPRVAGTYRFYDTEGRLLYVGKSKNLHQRVGSYFREDGPPRSERVQRLLDGVHRIEYEAVGSDLEAVLREAEMIRRYEPERNVQRNIRAQRGRAERLRSILILEPASAPAVLRAYLIRDGRLVDRVAIGPRGGGLKRIERILDDRFFSTPDGPTTIDGPDLDVEVVVRWLAQHRDRVVAFDPTDLRSTREVVDRLRWFLGQGSPFDPDGSPIVTR